MQRDMLVHVLMHMTRMSLCNILYIFLRRNQPEKKASAGYLVFGLKQTARIRKFRYNKKHLNRFLVVKVSQTTNPKLQLKQERTGIAQNSVIFHPSAHPERSFFALSVNFSLPLLSLSFIIIYYNMFVSSRMSLNAMTLMQITFIYHSQGKLFLKKSLMYKEASMWNNFNCTSEIICTQMFNFTVFMILLSIYTFTLSHNIIFLHFLTN